MAHGAGQITEGNQPRGASKCGGLITPIREQYNAMTSPELRVVAFHSGLALDVTQLRECALPRRL